MIAIDKKVRGYTMCISFEVMFMRGQWMILPVIVGVVMLITDMKYGWLSLFLGGFSSLLVIALVVGIIVGGVKDGILSVLVVEFLGVLLITLLMPYVFPEWYALMAGFIPIDMLLVCIAIIQNSATLGTLGLPWYLVGEFMPGEIGLGTVIMAPFIFGIALVLGGLGGHIGRIIRQRFMEPNIPSKAMSPSQPIAQEPQEEDTG
jgi:hypothetical protein